MDDHQQYQDLLALRVLGVLDAAEARSLDEHLATCGECQAEHAEWSDAAGLLAHAAVAAAPGDVVRQRILDAVRADSRKQETADGRAKNVVSMRPRAERLLWPNILRLAAAIAFVAMLIGVIVLWRRDVQSRREIAQLSRQLNAQQHELVRERDALAREREARALLNSPDAKKLVLAGSQTAQNARATFVFDQKSGRAMLITEGLPAAPAEMAYEVWFIPKGHAPIPGRVFVVDSAGHAMIFDQIPSEAREGVVIAVTIEPKRGSAAPTGGIYLSSPSS